MYSHDEADITIISHLIEAVKNGKNIVRVISDDIDVFVLLIFCVWRLQMTARVQLGRGYGAILNINEGSSLLGAKSLVHYQAAILRPIHLVMAKRRR